MRIRARHYATAELVDVSCSAGRIATIGPPGSAPVDREVGWIAPALFDLQINGALGHNFTSRELTVDAVHHVYTACRSHGIGSFCPALITASVEVLTHGLSTVCRARADDSAIEAAIPAIHLEGPYISSEDGPRGAHPRQHVRRPDWVEFQRLQEAAGGLIRLVTLAPELEGGLKFIERLTHASVVVALGHTAATPTQIRDAVSAGARLSTHLGNGCHSILPRHPNYVWEQLADDRLWASIICDGHHLPASVAKCIVCVKSPAQTILTCDASPLAGLPSGNYREWDQDLEVAPEGKVVLTGTPYLAGSAVFTDTCVANAVRFTGVSLSDAINMASARPRELLGLPPRRLQVGDTANFVLFDWDGEHLTLR
jgi:N-acetylglucosamine-6-phosphate deacetylase